MKINISEQIWDASGRNEGNINGTLEWILGYLSPENINLKLLKTIYMHAPQTIHVSIKDELVNEIIILFGDCNNDLTSTLIAMGYALGGQE